MLMLTAQQIEALHSMRNVGLDMKIPALEISKYQDDVLVRVAHRSERMWKVQPNGRVTLVLDRTDGWKA